MSVKHTADPDLAAVPHPCESWPDDGRAFRETLDRIGDKWSVLVIGILSRGPLRFSALQHHVPGVSQRMLTRTLRHLERDGVVSRTAYAEVPPRVEYQLTPLGESLRTIVHALAQWVTDHHGEVESARHRYDAE